MQKVGRERKKEEKEKKEISIGVSEFRFMGITRKSKKKRDAASRKSIV